MPDSDVFISAQINKFTALRIRGFAKDRKITIKSLVGSILDEWAAEEASKDPEHVRLGISLNRDIHATLHYEAKSRGITLNDHINSLLRDLSCKKLEEATAKINKRATELKHLSCKKLEQVHAEIDKKALDNKSNLFRMMRG